MSNPEDVYFPIDGGDQYEHGLPIVKLLIDGGNAQEFRVVCVGLPVAAHDQ